MLAYIFFEIIDKWLDLVGPRSEPLVGHKPIELSFEGENRRDVGRQWSAL
jgi:hypothetical protein